MTVATFVERDMGTAHTLKSIYHAPWFVALWIIAASTGLIALARKRRSAAGWGTHLAITLILTVAALTHFTGKSGRLHLRQNAPTHLYADDSHAKRVKHLPFDICLESFHENNDDYACSVIIRQNDGSTTSHTIGINAPLSFQGVRLTLFSIAPDRKGCTCSVNIDPYGRTTSFAGYALLFLSLTTLLIKHCMRGEQSPETEQPASGLWLLVGCGLFAYLTYTLASICETTGHLPFTDSTSTACTIAWIALLLSFRLKTWRRILLPSSVAITTGAIAFHTISGSTAAHPIPAVLNSPLLGIHVFLIATAYALFAFIFICSTAFLIRPNHRLTRLSHALLLPAVCLLAAGIFTGAIWGDLSWGRYWGWDAKETWALITLLIYCLPLHTESLPFLRDGRAYHAYTAAAFFILLMTFIGVNFLFTGLHSYA